MDPFACFKLFSKCTQTPSTQNVHGDSVIRALRPLTADLAIRRPDIKSPGSSGARALRCDSSVWMWAHVDVEDRTQTCACARAMATRAALQKKNHTFGPGLAHHRLAM